MRAHNGGERHGEQWPHEDAAARGELAPLRSLLPPRRRLRVARWATAPHIIGAAVALCVAVTTATWLRNGKRHERAVLSEAVAQEQWLADMASGLVAPVVTGLSTDLDRLSRVASVRYLHDTPRLERTVSSFLDRVPVDSLVLVRIDTTGAVLFVRSAVEVSPQLTDALARSGFLRRAAVAREPLISLPVDVPPHGAMIALSDRVQPRGEPPLGAIIAAFPLSVLTSLLRPLQLDHGRQIALVFGDASRAAASTSMFIAGLDADIGSVPTPSTNAVVARAVVGAETQPALHVELRRNADAILAPLRQHRPRELALLLALNSIIAAAGGLLVREIRLRRTLQENEIERSRLQQQLADAERQASLARLAGGVAQELNNLLTVIQGSVRNLQTRTLHGPDADQEVCAIVDASGQATALATQLLAVARRQPARPRVVQVSEALQALEARVRCLLPDNVALVIERDTAACISIDPGHLDQLVLNLAARARDIMLSGGILRLRVEDVPPDDIPGGTGAPHLQLTVEDTGPAIPPRAMPRLFEPFVHGAEGTPSGGLGLAAVKGIVTQAGGILRVDSRPHAGTRFILLFPTVPREEPAGAAGGQAFHMLLPAVTEPETSEAAPARTAGEHAPPETASATQADVGTGHGTGLTVLVAEDNADIRRLLVRVLSRDGFRVLSAASGEEALQFLGSHRQVDLLLTDVVMPGMSGRELAAKVQQSLPIPVVFMSGYTEDDVLHAGIRTEAVGFLEKPFTSERVLGIIRDTLAKRSRATG